MGERKNEKRYRNGSVVRLADKAADAIRRMIVGDEFSPWEPLSEVQLAKMLEVSRTPIREAITQLEQEGLLKVVPGRGAFVVELTDEDFREINTLRTVLEPLAAQTAIQRIPPEKIEKQSEFWKRVAADLSTCGSLSTDALTEADAELHWLFIEHCDNSRLRNFLNVLRCQTARYVYASWATKAFMEETVGQHLDIIRAMEEKEPENLREALEKHIRFNDQVFACRGR